MIVFVAIIPIVRIYNAILFSRQSPDVYTQYMIHPISQQCSFHQALLQPECYFITNHDSYGLTTPHLVGLHLQSLHIADSDVLSWVLKHCPFYVIKFSLSPQCDAGLVEFLEHQDQIQDLMLGSCSPNLILKLTALPKLAKVKAQALWLSILVPGCPVHNVTFNDTSHSAELNVKFLLLSITPIQCLLIVAKNVYTLPIPHFATVIPQLHVFIVNCSFIDCLDTWVSPCFAF
jgi:hypothetical protein